MRNEARLAMNRVNMRDAYVMHETAGVFISQMTQFAETTPDLAEAAAAAHLASIEQAYGVEPGPTERKPFIYQDGMAVIPIHGVLLNRFGGSYSFATGYNYIRRVMNAALADDDVTLIVYDVDSPGGEAAGCFELAQEMRAARDVKPSIAVVDSLCASAGYALASAATRLVATPSSKIGSIGVIRMHMNMQGALDKMGIEVTIIEAPEEGMKSAGSPFRALTREEKADFQDSVNAAYDDFVQVITENRGLADGEVRDTKAKVFRADEALALGLIDEVKTPTEAVSSFVAELADNDIPPEDDEDEAMTKTAAEVASAAAAPAAAPAAAAPVVDVQAAIAADRERMSAIKALPEAAERPKLADHLALSGLTVNDAKATLAVAAVETAPAAAAPAAGAEATSVDGVNHLENAMNGSKQPEVGAGGGGAGAAASAVEPTSEDLAASILKDQGSVIGRNYGEAAKA